MKISVVQRTVIGFALMFCLMALISSVSFFNAKTMQEKVEHITQKSTPVVVASGQLINKLAETNLFVQTYGSSGQPEDTSAFQQLHQQYKLTLDNIAVKIESPRDQRTLRDIEVASGDYFSGAEQLLTVKTTLLQLENQQDTLMLQFMRLEDTYNWAANLLLQKAAVKRSLRNRAELITSGIARDLKALRRADRNTDLETLKKTLTKDIEIAFKRLERISVPEDVKTRFTRNLNRMSELTLGENGLIAILSQQKSQQQVWTTANEQTQAQLNTIRNKLNDYVIYANQQSEQSMIEADEALNDALYSTLSMTFIAAVIGLFVVVSTTRKIQKPLSKIRRVLNELKNGDMRKRTNYISHDEFGELSTAIDSMADTMASTLSEFNVGAKQVLDEAQRSASVSESSQMRAEDQRSRTEQVAAAIAQMEVSAKEISRATEMAVAEVDGANDAADKGRAQVTLSRKLTESLSANVEQAAINMKQLKDYSSNIGSVLYVIEEIAEQTNLLALNAAIEAARAGSQGRGFAVVADEVRALANRTQQSTEEIKSMISQLQNNATNMAETMSHSQDQMSDCLQQTRITDDMLQDIAGRMAAIQEMAIHVAQATEEQIKVSTDVAEHIHGIAIVATDAERDAKDSASSSASLSELAVGQQSLISKFRV
ncbi:methyl-accepting chemotaxis protein [Veronia nyctiphanis]|uniref:Methyl-accepting chemotaxis protein n=1 Tax=Veronia nyctiphanis TaxID=1278244 RepID=A0A4Q0YSJ5_9GAMM|nr:methyl-accepting chemotaxis protein [Veronia nyctiphanis]RXJ73643.1 methyl-accepting chemotaxis protein [Veronia nyctiphanis]